MKRNQNAQAQREYDKYISQQVDKMYNTPGYFLNKENVDFFIHMIQQPEHNHYLRKVIESIKPENRRKNYFHNVELEKYCIVQSRCRILSDLFNITFNPFN